MSRTILPVLLVVACLTACGKKKPEPEPTPEPTPPAPQPGPALPRPTPPAPNPPQPAQNLMPVYRFWDARHTEHVYTYGDGEPADWRKNSAFTKETVIGYAATIPCGGTTRLMRVYCKDERHYFPLTTPTFAPDVERFESFELYVWITARDGRVPIHACLLPDDKDAYFDQDLQKVKDYAEEALKKTGTKRKVVEGMFYLYPTASAPYLAKQATISLSTPATSLPPLPVRDSIPVFAIYTLAATPDGAVLAAGGHFKGVSILDRTPAMAHIALPPTEGTTERMLALAPNGRFIAAAGTDMTIHVWDIKADAEIGTLKTGSPYTCAAFTPDGKTLYFSGDQEKEVKLWDTTTRKVVGTLPHQRVQWMNMTPDGKFLAASSGPEMRVWNLSAGGEPVTSFPDVKGGISAVALTPDGKTVVFGAGDGSIKIWDIEASTVRVVIQAHPGRGAFKVASLAMSPDGKFVASAGAGGSAGVWEVATGRGLAAAPAAETATGNVYAVAITDGGKTLLTATGGNIKGPDGTWKGGVKAWDLTALTGAKK